MFERINYENLNLNKIDLDRFIYKLNQEGCHTHSIIMLKNDKIFFDKYFDSYNELSLFRMYSETKSLVSISILFLINENKLSLDDKLASYFPEYISDKTHEFLLNQTIKESLMMETSVIAKDWFKEKEDDRVKIYFDSDVIRPSGLVWRYDSAVSQVLEALIEKITGLNCLEYLKLKIFNDLGTFKTAYMLKTPDNRYWGDSGLIATSLDMASFGIFLLNKGKINGKEYLPSYLIEEATSRLTCNNEIGYLNYRGIGYGYQFFKTKYDGFMLAGLGNQLTIIFPKYDLIFVFNSNDQGIKEHRETLLNLVYDLVDKISDNDYKDIEYDCYKLNIEKELIKKINNKEYKSCKDFVFNNFKLSFNDLDGYISFNYLNKIVTIPFGINEYKDSKLNIEGYSNMVGKEATKGYFYDIKTKLIFSSSKKIIIDIEIIDKYNGSLYFLISFKDNYAWVKSIKYAENFLNDFNGEMLFKINE